MFVVMKYLKSKTLKDVRSYGIIWKMKPLHLVSI